MAAHITGASAAPLSCPIPDPVALHMQALNCLERSKHMLLVREPLYLFALDELAKAQAALSELAALDAAAVC